MGNDMMEDGRCYFCGSRKPFVDIGISLGMFGRDYWFCWACAGEKSVRDLIRTIFKDNGLAWPPRRGKDSSTDKPAGREAPRG